MRFSSASELGNIVRRVRTRQGLTQPQLAAACGTGVRFIVDLEKGKPTCELQKTLLVVSMLGIAMEASSVDLESLP
ncbi:MAG: helix-turn-helix transcriptional regulator [Candidatus Obscuribacterales bacterium]